MQKNDLVKVSDRFWAKVRKTNECWLWTAGCFNTGYGIFRIGSKNLKAHRVAWLLTHDQEPPPELYVCHTCDNPLCVNPAHLFLGTAKDNANDRDRKGRTKTPYHKTTQQDQATICRLYFHGLYTQQELADEFSISRSRVNNIVNQHRRTNENNQDKT